MSRSVQASQQPHPDSHAKPIKPPKQLTPNQRKPSVAETTITPGMVVIFTVPGFLMLAEQMGVIVRTPTCPGGVMNSYDILPLPGFSVGNPRYLASLFEQLVVSDKYGWSPPVPILIDKESILEIVEPGLSIEPTEYVELSNQQQAGYKVCGK